MAAAMMVLVSVEALSNDGCMVVSQELTAVAEDVSSQTDLPSVSSVGSC
jgi:hypothetical protein